MKIHLYLLLLFGLLSCSNSNSFDRHKMTDWERLNLKGKVKHITESIWKAEGDFGAFEKDESNAVQKVGQLSFNKEGYLTIEQGANYRKEYLYGDDLTKCTEMKEYYWINNKKGGLKSTYQYNEQGQLIAQIIHYPEGKPPTTLPYEYDSEGNNTLGYTSLGVILLNEYNDEGQAIRYKAYLSKSDYEKDRNATTGYYKYDQNGNKIEQGYSSGNGLNQTKWKYDAYGNKIEEVKFHNEKERKKRTFTYQYDKQNNWTWRAKKNNNYLNERVLTYY